MIFSVFMRENPCKIIIRPIVLEQNYKVIKKIVCCIIIIKLVTGAVLPMAQGDVTPTFGSRLGGTGRVHRCRGYKGVHENKYV